VIEEITLVPVPAFDPILPDTDPLLRTISAPVTVFDDELCALADRMANAMLIRRGLGLAAVQIGRPVRLILVREHERLIFMANPTGILITDKEPAA
jgi:peptide deformylase